MNDLIYNYIFEQIGINHPTYPIDPSNPALSLRSLFNYIADNHAVLFDGVTVQAYFDQKDETVKQARIAVIEEQINKLQEELVALKGEQPVAEIPVEV